MTRPPNGNSPGRLTPKWAIAIVIAVLAYAVFQPLANSRLGWDLPAVTNLLGLKASTTDGTEAGRVEDASSDIYGQLPASSQTEPAASAAGQALSEPIVDHGGYLRELAAQEYISPAGLRYTTGSAEGHRLLHLARHLKDQPDRPSKHGVFSGELPQVLKLVDDAYQLAEEGRAGTTKTPQGARTVYEAEFSQPIGYVGGRTGRQQGNPPADSLRLVTEGNQVITAFPF